MKKILGLKRKLIIKGNSPEQMKKENSLFDEVVNETKSIADEILEKRKEKNESNSSGNKRIIVVIKDEEKIILSTENIKEFLDFINCFNCLFYIKNGIRQYLINPKTIEQFFDNSHYHVLYNLDFLNLFDEKIFIFTHCIPKRKNIKTIKEFCLFHEWYFNLKNHDFYYTALWSPNRILKFNRLNDKNYGKYMDKKFDKCSNSRITKFYGPFGTGKSTLVYAFFKTISYVESLINSGNNNNSDEKKDNINFEKLNLKKKSNIKIKKYKKKLPNNIEVDENSFDLVYSSSDSDSNKSNNSINLEEIEKKEISFEKKESKENEEIKHIIYKDYEKEYEGNDSTDEEYNFLSSCYIDLEKERIQEVSNANKKYFEYEIMQLFKTYKFYKYIISYLNSNKKNNIFERIKQIVDFMKEIKNKRNYFIIIDHISENDQKDIIDLENYVLEDPYCYVIELPLIKTIQEKINFLKDFYVYKEDDLESYDDKDEITFIKRNKKYGIVYSTNFYSPKFSDDEEDITYEENFGKNIYFYCIWKFSKKKLNINEFIKQIIDELCEIFKENYNHDKDKLAFNIKTILDVIEEKKEIKDKDFLAQLPLDYFVLINKKNKYLLEYSFPLIEKVIQKLNVFTSTDLIKSRYFISYFDNFIKGGIMEKVFAEKMKENYLKITNNKLISINIHRIIDNNIRDFFRYDEENYILKKNKQFMKIKNENNNLKNENILFNQSQNAKHYDLGIKLLNIGNIYGFFQVTFHKSTEDIMELINNLWIDLNYGINKIKNLCNEENENILGLYIFFVLMDLGSYGIKNKTKEEIRIIEQNKKYNKNIIKILNEYNIDYLFLDNKGNITKDGQIIKKIPFKLNLVSNFKQKINELNFQKEQLEEKYTDYFQKLFPKNKIELLYFHPIYSLKLKEERILVHLFNNIDDNYFQMNEKGSINYYNMKKMKIDKHVVDEIEKKNKKVWKMNIFMKLN